MSRDGDFYTPLHRAAYNDHTQVAEVKGMLMIGIIRTSGLVSGGGGGGVNSDVIQITSNELSLIQPQVAEVSGFHLILILLFLGTDPWRDLKQS